MGGKSEASTSTANTQNTQNLETVDTTTTSNEVSGSGSIGLTGSGNTVGVTQISTDAGTVQASKDIALSALGSNSDVAQAGLDLGRVIGTGSLDFANEFGNNALATVQSTTENGLHQALDFGSSAVSALGSSNKDTANILGNAIQAAGEQTRSDTADSLNKIAKYGAIVLGIFGVVGLLVWMGKK